MIPPRATAVLGTQAAGEYVGVLLSGAARDLRNGLFAAGRYFEDNPIAVIAVVGGCLILMRLGRRRRR